MHETMLRVACVAAALVLPVAGFASPAWAVDVAPIDTTAWAGLSYDVGATSMGGFLSLGPLRLGAAGYTSYLYGLGLVGGLSTSLAWRMSPPASRGLAWGWGVTSYAVGGLTERSQEMEGYALYPALIGTLPLGKHFLLRVSGGPVFFSGQTSWLAYSGTTMVRRGATGFLPFVPNPQLVWRLDSDSEVTIGGFPSLVGWRHTL